MKEKIQGKNKIKKFLNAFGIRRDECFPGAVNFSGVDREKVYAFKKALFLKDPMRGMVLWEM
jgi:hypothetical protein